MMMPSPPIQCVQLRQKEDSGGKRFDVGQNRCACRRQPDIDSKKQSANVGMPGSRARR
jgi:hypothetical protein